MKKCSKCGIDKPFSDFSKRSGGPGGCGYRSDCKKCSNTARRAKYAEEPEKFRALSRAWSADNPEYRADYNKMYREENPDKCATAQANWRNENREHIRLYDKARVEAGIANLYYHANSERINAQRKERIDPVKEAERHRKYHEKNPHKTLAACRKYQADKIRATPSWADLKAIEAIYEERARISKETGIVHHVDHIVPLRGKNVCGLHVHYNLRVIPASENLKKSNQLDIEVLENVGYAVAA